MRASIMPDADWVCAMLARREAEIAAAVVG